MITIQANSFDILDIEKELNLKVGGIKELSSRAVLEELANAVFTLSAKAFVKAMNIEAKANPKNITTYMSGDKMDYQQEDYSFYNRNFHSNNSLQLRT